MATPPVPTEVPFQLRGFALYCLILSSCVRRAFTARTASDGSFPWTAACLARARLSTSSIRRQTSGARVLLNHTLDVREHFGDQFPTLNEAKQTKNTIDDLTFCSLKNPNSPTKTHTKTPRKEDSSFFIIHSCIYYLFTDSRIDQLIDWLFVRLIDWLSDWLIDCLIDWVFLLFLLFLPYTFLIYIYYLPIDYLF